MRSLFGIAALSVIGCAEPFSALAGNATRAASRAEELFGTLEARVTDPIRDKKYEGARVKIVNAALTPSRIWNDTSVWTSSTTARRSLVVGGRFADGRYRLVTGEDAPPPKRPTESRHVIQLTRLGGGDDEFAWDTEVPYAIGSVTAREIGRFSAALFASAEGRSEADVRADYRRVAPQFSAVLGQLFRIDSIRTTHLPDRSTLATFSVTMTPHGVAPRYPNFATYVRNYFASGRMKFALTDRRGVSYLEASLIRGRMLLKVRTLNGALVALTGEPRVMPDSLTLRGEMAMKVRRFTVGFHDYQAGFTIERSDHERALNIVSRVEPRWDLPLLTEQLLKTPLRRPFEGSGAQFRIGVRDSAGAQTLLTRRLHLEVEESLILRFVGRLGATAMADFRGKAQQEQLAWLRDLFAALVTDVRTH